MELVELEQGWEGNFIHWMNVVDNVLNRMGFPLHVMEKVVYKERQLETVKRRGIGNCRNSDEGGQGQMLCVQKNENVLGTSCNEI